MNGFRMRATRLLAAFATVTTALVFTVAGPASATVKTTSGLATVTQTPTVSTPGFNTACTVANKTQNCAEIRTQTQVGSYMVLGVSFQQVQNYEKGANGISAVRLFDFCKILNVSLVSMFPPDHSRGLPGPVTRSRFYNRVSASWPIAENQTQH